MIKQRNIYKAFKSISVVKNLQFIKSNLALDCHYFKYFLSLGITTLFLHDSCNLNFTNKMASKQGQIIKFHESQENRFMVLELGVLSMYIVFQNDLIKKDQT